MSARRAYARKRSARGAARRDAILHARGARRRNEILEHASPVLGSGLGKIVQAGDPGTVTPRRGAWRSGARGADFVRGRGARGAGQRPQRPCQPWTKHLVLNILCRRPRSSVHNTLYLLARISAQNKANRQLCQRLCNDSVSTRV